MGMNYFKNPSVLHRKFPITKNLRITFILYNILKDVAFLSSVESSYTNKVILCV